MRVNGILFCAMHVWMLSAIKSVKRNICVVSNLLSLSQATRKVLCKKKFGGDDNNKIYDGIEKTKMHTIYDGTIAFAFYLRYWNA